MVSGSEWPDKDELLDVLYWGRQLLALMIGIFWGFIPLHGFLAIVLYIVISTAVGQLYATNFQKVCYLINVLLSFSFLLFEVTSFTCYWSISPTSFSIDRVPVVVVDIDRILKLIALESHISIFFFYEMVVNTPIISLVRAAMNLSNTKQKSFLFDFFRKHCLTQVFIWFEQNSF